MDKKTFYIPHLGVAIPHLGWIPAPRYSMRRSLVLELAGQIKGSVLDIGCGPGALLVDFKRLGCNPVGLEISSESHRISKSLNQDLNIYSSPKENWKGHFDLIMALEVLEHLKDDKKELEVWKAWMKGSATAIFSVPAHPMLWNEGDLNVGHYRRYSKKSLIKLLTDAGFDVQSVNYYGFPIATFIEIIRFGVLTTPLEIFWSKLAGNNLSTPTSSEYTHRTKKSGSDRRNLVKYWPIVSSFPYKIFLSVCCKLQNIPFLGFFGNGLIIVARIKKMED